MTNQDFFQLIDAMFLIEELSCLSNFFLGFMAKFDDAVAVGRRAVGEIPKFLVHDGSFHCEFVAA